MTISTTNPRTAGYTAARFVKSLVAGGGDRLTAAGFAAGQRWNDANVIAEAHKAAVVAHSAADIESAMRPIGLDLAEAARAATLVGRMEGFRRVGLRVRSLAFAQGPTGGFVQAGKPLPVSAAALSDKQVLDPRFVGALIVLSRELLDYGGPGADAMLRDELVRAVVEAMDTAFIDPAIGPTADGPASVLYDADPIPSTGTDADSISDDLAALVGRFTDARISLIGVYWVLHPRSAMHLGRLRLPLNGPPAFPGIGPLGGTLLGLPALTSEAVPIAGSPGETIIALVSPPNIAIADDGEATIDVATQGALELLDDPTNASVDGTPTTQVSLYQSNSIAVRALRAVHWKKRRPGAAQFISGVQY